jgi:hypothetical protein
MRCAVVSTALLSTMPKTLFDQEVIKVDQALSREYQLRNVNQEMHKRQDVQKTVCFVR